MARSANLRGWDGVTPDRNMLTLKEVANRYGVTYGTAYQWARARKIPAFQLGDRGPWRVYSADLDAMERRSGRVGGAVR